MSAAPGGPAETRQFWRSAHIPGFELIEAKASWAPYQVYNVEYTIGIPATWAGRVNHDGRAQNVGGGEDALLFRPGELLSSPGAVRPGDLRVMIISRSALEQYAGEHLSHPTRLDWKARLARCSPELRSRFRQVFAHLHDSPTAMQFQTAMTNFFSVAMGELVTDAQPADKDPDGSRQAVRMRELMHHAPEGLTIGLTELAEAVGMTRFQALRAFKRKYGVPPHTYQLAVRVGLAAALLGRGASVTQVAHEMGFTDQSHFTRHFKRLWRVTPGSYASRARALPLPPSSPTTRSDGVTFRT